MNIHQDALEMDSSLVSPNTRALTGEGVVIHREISTIRELKQIPPK